MKRILVTGATGYIGKRIATALLETGCEVVYTSRKKMDGDALIPHPFAKPVELCNSSSLSKTFETYQFDAVIHLASVAKYDTAFSDIPEMIESNLTFGTQLLELCIQHKVKSFINTGTFWQFLNGEVDEPSCLYAATKSAFEKILDYYVSAHGLKALTLILFDVYGPNDSRKKLFNILKDQAPGTDLQMSEGLQELAPVHIDDVVSAYRSALVEVQSVKVNRKANHYFVRGSESYSLKEIVELYQKQKGIRFRVSWGKRPYRARENMRLVDGPRLPGWAPKINLAHGLQTLV